VAKHSTGFNLTAGASNPILTVPTGYDALVSYLFISNGGQNTKSVTATWHDGVDVIFLSGKSVSAGDHIDFGGSGSSFLVMREGDYMTIEPEAASTFSCIISYDLYPAAPRLNI
jgi:hypothetical protein